MIAMLLIFQIGSLISNLFGMAWGAVSAVVVAGVSFFSARFAKRVTNIKQRIKDRFFRLLSA